jgi:hypothetical protein
MISYGNEQVQPKVLYSIWGSGGRRVRSFPHIHPLKRTSFDAHNQERATLTVKPQRAGSTI